jgi:uncharacterized membrane protein YhaH (DUF805 family)
MIIEGEIMDDWQYLRDGNASETMSELKLRDLAEVGMVHTGTYVRRSSYSDWRLIIFTEFAFKSSLMAAPSTPLTNNTPNPFAASETPNSTPSFISDYRPTEYVAGLGLFAYFTRALSKKYVDFSGRARRKEYWGFYLFYILTLFVVTCAGAILDGAMNLGAGKVSSDIPPTFTLGFLTVAILGTFLPALAVTVRRLHDIGVSGWLYLISLVPYVGGLVIFVMTLIPGQAGSNSYGPSPKEDLGLDVANVFN